jgi:SnoaL-like polyketide cyclase
MTHLELEEIARHWIEQGWQRGEASVVDRLHAQDFIDHDPGGRSPDRAGFKQGIATLFQAFSDFRAVIEDLVVDEARQVAAVRWSATGTLREQMGAGGATSEE